MPNSREINKNIRHDIAETFASYGVEWTGLHDNVIDSPIERHIRPLVEALALMHTALSETVAHLAGYNWNADPLGLTKKQGDAFAAIARLED